MGRQFIEPVSIVHTSVKWFEYPPHRKWNSMFVVDSWWVSQTLPAALLQDQSNHSYRPSPALLSAEEDCLPQSVQVYKGLLPSIQTMTTLKGIPSSWASCGVGWGLFPTALELKFSLFCFLHSPTSIPPDSTLSYFMETTVYLKSSCYRI